jgi:hypothetical protein
MSRGARTWRSEDHDDADEVEIDGELRLISRSTKEYAGQGMDAESQDKEILRYGVRDFIDTSPESSVEIIERSASPSILSSRGPSRSASTAQAQAREESKRDSMSLEVPGMSNVFRENSYHRALRNRMPSLESAEHVLILDLDSGRFHNITFCFGFKKIQLKQNRTMHGIIYLKVTFLSMHFKNNKTRLNQSKSTNLYIKNLL